MNPQDSLPPLLGPDDPPAYRVEEDTGQRPVLLVCDHASNILPARLGDLGLEQQYFQRHIALDIGAAGLTRRLARRLEGPAVYCGYSRLVIDCNRQPGDPTSIPPVSDGVIIPGNQDLGDPQADQRADEIFWPYHHAVGQTLSHLWRRGHPPALISIHSFTPVMNGFERPWHIGVLWNHDPRLAVPLVHRLRADPALCVG
ncbi:MAG: N-formylglutamate amidohydrolase, partial [Candidatus Competibacteraceae bacterium]|nr:N-formylglutamate amidohydrolase [Candidatus Competibacteraceae bacterium]